MKNGEISKNTIVRFVVLFFDKMWGYLRDYAID